MPQRGIPGYLKYRVIDANSDAEVVGDLPHRHQSEWMVRALQAGFPGSATIGDFRIPLPGPGTAGFKRHRDKFMALATRQKIEGYLGDVIAGAPRYSGVITGLNRPATGDWEIIGSDTLWWLQQSQALPGEVLGTIRGDQIVGTFMTTQEVLWDDDFTLWGTSSHPNVSDYTVSAGVGDRV